MSSPSLLLSRFVLFLGLVGCALLFESVRASYGDGEEGDLRYYSESDRKSSDSGDLQRNSETIKQRRYDGAQLWRILISDDKDNNAVQELEEKFDGQLWKQVKKEVDYLIKSRSVADAEQFVQSANLSHVVLIDDLQKIIDDENPSSEEIESFQNRKGHRLTWKAYHRVADIHGFLDYLAKTYPKLCTVETIGTSVQKRPLKVIRISNGQPGNRAIWIDGGMHAREWISQASVTYIINKLVEGWEDLPPYIRSIDWYINPVANPDGYEHSHVSDRLWRKNLRSHGRQCPGVDLNRNFGYSWGGKGTSANPCAQTYRGGSAFSEPETAAIRAFLTKKGSSYVKASLSFHSYGQYILFPWGHENMITTDHADLDRVAREAAARIARSGNVKYTVGPAAKTLYPAAGGSDDWARGVLGIKYTYTMELRDTGRYGFILPASMIEQNGQDGWHFVDTVAKNVVQNRDI